MKNLIQIGGHSVDFGGAVSGACKIERTSADGTDVATIVHVEGRCDECGLPFVAIASEEARRWSEVGFADINGSDLDHNGHPGIVLVITPAAVIAGWVPIGDL